MAHLARRKNRWTSTAPLQFDNRLEYDARVDRWRWVWRAGRDGI